MGAKNSYGLKKRDSNKNKIWQWVILIGLVVWGLMVSSWTTQRIAALFAYHEGLGLPVHKAVDRFWYLPWMFIEWADKFGHYPQVKRILDQAYLIGVGVPILSFILYMASQQGLKVREDLHGSARWAEKKDIVTMGYFEGKGVYIGGWYDEKKNIHHYLRHDGPEHILCFAPTRSGKGVGLILPTLLAWEHSSFVLDIKGENFALTSGYLKSLGHTVLRFDPSDSSGASAAFNPLAEIRLDTPEAIPDTQLLAEMVMDPAGKGMDDYWSKAAFGFFGGAMLHCLIKTLFEKKRPANLNDLAIMLEDPERPVSEVFEEMLNMEHASMLGSMFPDILTAEVEKDEDGNVINIQAVNELGEAAHLFIASAARGMLSKADNELSGVVNTATSNLALYKNPVVAMNTSRCDFRISDLMNNDHPVNLYMVIPPSSINTLRPLLRIFVTQLIGRLIEKMEFKDGASVAGYKHKLLMLLDEFTSLGKLPVMEKGIAYVAGYGIKLYLIVQDTKQLNEAYGPDNAFMANCHIRLAYAPNLMETAEMLSKMAGTTTIVDKKVSISGGKGGRSSSTSVSETSRPLLTADECTRLPGIRKIDGEIVPGDILIFTAGHSPIYGRQILYFLDSEFLSRAKVKAPGLDDGWPSGLSESFYHPMPIKGSKPKALLKAEATTLVDGKSNEAGFDDMEADIAAEYRKLLTD